MIKFPGQDEISLSSQLFKYDMAYQLGFFKPPGRWNNSLLVLSVQTIGAECIRWRNPTKIWSGERSANPTVAPTAAAAAAVSKHCGECKHVNVFIKSTCIHSCNQGIWVKLENSDNTKHIYFASFLNLILLEQFCHLFIEQCIYHHNCRYHHKYSKSNDLSFLQTTYIHTMSQFPGTNNIMFYINLSPPQELLCTNHQCNLNYAMSNNASLICGRKYRSGLLDSKTQTEAVIHLGQAK